MKIKDKVGIYGIDKKVWFIWLKCDNGHGVPLYWVGNERNGRRYLENEIYLIK